MISKTKTSLGQSLETGLFLKTALLFIALFVFGATGCDTGNEKDVGDGNEDSETSEDSDTGDDSSDDDSDEDGGDENDGGDEDDTESDTGEEEDPYTTALVVTSDYSTGAYGTVSLDDYEATKEIDSIYSDAACRFDSSTDTPFLILRYGSDAIDVLDPDTFKIETEYSVEAMSNPYDIAVVSEERAYVPRYGSEEMLIVNPFTGKQDGTVDFGDYSDEDGTPEMTESAVFDGTVYVPVQRLDSSWTPVGKSYVVLVDAETGDIDGDIELTGTNPYGGPQYSEALGQFVIAEPGSSADLENAGIELLNPETDEVSGFIITEDELGGNVYKGLVLTETKGYALIGAGEYGADTHVVTFNPETGKKEDSVLEGDGWVYGDIALTPDGSELWVADRTTDADGIRIFDTQTDKEITDEPIDMGLPPTDICFTR